MEYNKTMKTTYENKLSILSDLWMNCRDDEEFADFIDYCDIALPLAYCIKGGIVKSTDKAAAFIDEAFALLLNGLEIEEDTGFESLEELLG